MVGFTIPEAATIGIIGGADGPTTIYLASNLAPHLMGPTSVAAYSYMALVPLIIPPVAKLLTTKKERAMVMTQMRSVSKGEKLIFPLLASIVIILIVPPAAPLITMFMLGNLFMECVVERLTDVSRNALMNIITIFLGLGVGSTMSAENFLNTKTIYIFILGVFSFIFAAAGGVIIAKIMNLFTKNKVNPLIGAAGVSAVPMAARVVHVMGAEANPQNYLLMHAMGPNVAGVIGTAVAAGAFILSLK